MNSGSPLELGDACVRISDDEVVARMLLKLL
jgi:hypothetical protein